MVKYTNDPVPFLHIGNRRGLTMLQLIENQALADFVKYFPASFEPAPNIDAVLFIEPEPDAS